MQAIGINKPQFTRDFLVGVILVRSKSIS